MRTSARAKGPAPDPPHHPTRSSRGWRLSDPWLVALTAGGILASFVAVYPLRGFHVPLGSDTPVYQWWARRAQEFGLGASDTGGRAALMGAMASLEAVLPVGMGVIAAVLGPVLAALTGLAAGSLVTTAVAERRPALPLTAVLSAAFLSFLVAGYLSTLGFAALFVAALACLARSFGAGRAAVVAAAALGGTAALSHPIFMAVAAVVVAGGALALIPGFRRDRAHGLRVGQTALGRVALASAGSMALFGAGILVVGLHTGSTVDTSRDAFLRRLHLPALTERSYRTVLSRSFTWWRSLLVAGSGALAAPSPVPTTSFGQDPRPGPRHDRRRWFWGLIAAWLAVTAGAIVALLLGYPVPGQRFAQFALPFPILAAIGLLAVRSRLGPGPGTLVLAAGTILYVGVMWSAWWDVRPLVPADLLSEAQTVARWVEGRPPHTPIVVVADDASGSPARFLIRDINYIRAQMPPDRILDVYLFVGTPSDFRLGKPGLSGNPEHDRLSFDASARLRLLAGSGGRPATTRPLLAVVLRSLDPEAFRSAATLPGAASLGPGVTAIQPAGTSLDLGPGGAGADMAGDGPISPLAPLWAAPLVLALLTGVGWPWAHLALRHAPGSLRAALVPVFGLAGVGLGSIAVDAIGMRLRFAGGFVAVLGVFLLGVAAAAARSRLPSDRARH